MIEKQSGLLPCRMENIFQSFNSTSLLCWMFLFWICDAHPLFDVEKTNRLAQTGQNWHRKRAKIRIIHNWSCNFKFLQALFWILRCDNTVFMIWLDLDTESTSLVCHGFGIYFSCFRFYSVGFILTCLDLIYTSCLCLFPTLLLCTPLFH